MDFVKLAIKGIPYIPKANPKVLMSLGTGVILAGAAAVKGVDGLARADKGKKVSLAKHKAAVDACEIVRLQTEQIASGYGRLQLETHSLVISRFADWLERNQAQVRRLNYKVVGGVRVKVPNIPKYAANSRNVMDGLNGVFSAVGVGMGAPAAALYGVTAFASAGTGTLISSLSGVAAQNAALAALGGGTVAAGGGGMAAGAAVLGLTAIVPMLIVGGFTLGIVGEKQKTASREFASKVEIEIRNLELTQDLLGAVQTRITELTEVLGLMTQRATTALDALDEVVFDHDTHAMLFLTAMQLVTSTKEILNTPVLDPDSGELTAASIEIVRKYS